MALFIDLSQKNGHKPNVCLRKKPKQLVYTEIHRNFAPVINRNELMIKLREMKKLMMVITVALLATVTAQAQRIRTIDKDGNPIPYVSIMTTDAKYIGITDLEGVIADVKGADTITVSHIAYKPKLYKVNGKSGSITLEDADFGLPEIVVKKKPYVYVQTYYRMLYYDDSLGVAYYRAGLTDNVIERAKKKLSANTNHTSKAKYGVLKVAINTLIGGRMDQLSEIRMEKLEKKIEKKSGKRYKITPNGENKKLISDDKGTVGSITDNQTTGERCFSFDYHKMAQHELEATGNAKKIAKEEKREAKYKNRQNSDYYIYRIDEKGNYLPEDFVMMQDITNYDKEEKDGKLVHTVMILQVFTTDRAYVDKEELKKLKKENKMKMNYQNIRNFEKAHKIPALVPTIQKKLNELWKADVE